MYPVNCGHELSYFHFRIPIFLEVEDRSREKSHVIEDPGGFNTNIKFFG